MANQNVSLAIKSAKIGNGIEQAKKELSNLKKETDSITISFKSLFQQLLVQ